MNYGIAHISIIPMRFEPNNKSEMINQILFGEHFKVIQQKAEWVKIRLAHDQYEGWICRKQYYQIDKAQFLFLSNDKVYFNPHLIDTLSSEKGEIIPIGLGSVLPFFNGSYCLIDGLKFFFDGAKLLSDKYTKSSVVNTAFMFLHAPYLWGGRTPMGVDCSGLTQMSYRLNGINLPRDAYQQVEIGSSLTFIAEAEAGDLAFFDNSDGEIIHVGIILENNHIIHASGKVRVDRIDQQGIFNKELGQHTHQLRIIKQIS